MELSSQNEIIIELIAKTHGMLGIYLGRKIREKGLNATPEQCIVLIALKLFPEMSQTDIAKKFFKDKTTVTRILDVLEKNEIINRKSDAVDRRIYRIYLTERGKKLTKDLIPIVNELDLLCRESLSQSELEILTAALHKIQKNIGERL